jgi:hypothetical protein
VLFARAEANAQNLLEVPFHPYRKASDKYYSLQPIYDWMKLPKSNESTRPMLEWVGVPEHRAYGLLYKVTQVLPDGLLVVSSGEYLVGIESSSFSSRVSSHEPIFLKNYPFKKLCVDGQKIRFLAIKSGNYKYTGTDGGSHTVELYDYGVPYDPKALQAAMQVQKTTNTTSLTVVSTNSVSTNRGAARR